MRLYIFLNTLFSGYDQSTDDFTDEFTDSMRADIRLSENVRRSGKG